VVVEVVVVDGWDLLSLAEAQNRQAGAEYGPWIAELVGDLPTWMITITHKDVDTHRLFSQRIRRQWLNKLNRQLFGGNYERRGEGLLSFFFIRVPVARSNPSTWGRLRSSSPRSVTINGKS
jgi:hypothetical protein